MRPATTFASLRSHLSRSVRATTYPLAHVALSAYRRRPSIRLVPVIRGLFHFQLRTTEIELVLKSLERRKAPNFLIFGLGLDSAFWATANRTGRTVFLEDNADWYQRMLRRTPSLTAHLVEYQTIRSQSGNLLATPNHEVLEMSLPPSIHATRWDVILVDGPAGHADEDPGRMQSIYMASRLVADDGDVLVHDINRLVEKQWSDRYLALGRTLTTVGRLCCFATTPGASHDVGVGG